ncbi:claudin-7-A-like [Branchiostoma floridae x Branchiostoma japonicum]
MTPLLVGGISSSLVGLVMYVVGIATPAWVKVGQQEWGLWQLCTTFAGARACVAYPDISKLTAAVNATRAFAIIGSLLLIAGIALACHAAYKNSNVDKTKYGVLIIAGGACGVIAVAIFGVRMWIAIGAVVWVPYGYSFHLTWVQALVTFGGGAAIIKAGCRNAENEQPMHREEVIAMRESII